MFKYIETNGKRVCIIIDELDRLSPAENWLSEVPLLIPRNLKIILVSRINSGLRARFDHAQVLELSGLSEMEARQLIEQRLGRVASEELRDRIQEQARGHPLFTGSLTDAVRDGLLDLAMLRLPPTLAQLSSRTQALEIAHPGIQDRLTVLVSQIAGQGPRGVRLEEVPAQLDAEELASIERSGLFVVERGEQGIWVRIAHTLIQDLLLERYGIAERFD